MISARRMTLVAVNLVLAGAGASVWASKEAPQQEQRVAARSQRSAPAWASTEPSSPAQAKPLFRVRPPAPAVVQEVPAESPLTAPNFRLAGVVWSSAEKVAVVQMTDDGQHRRLRLGESVGEWTLRELSARTALVEAGENRVELTLEPPASID